jgi:hypothetical protein
MDGSSGSMLGALVGGLIFTVIMLFLLLIPMWKVYTKAGKPGWGILIPIYNMYLLCKICNRPGWWVLLMIIPLVNIIITFIIYIDLAKVFGKGTGFGLGLIFLSFIFLPILGYGDAQYAGASTPAPTPAA